MRFPRSYALETRSCRLRHVSEADIPHIFEATRYPGFNDGMLWEPPATEAELFVPYQNNVDAWETCAAYCFTIETKIDSIFVGRIVIRSEDAPETWNLGFWTHPAQQSKGFMTEAAQAVIAFGFQELNARRILARHAVWNKASERVLQKCGLTLIRHEPQGFQKRGAWVAENVLEIARADWEASQPTPARKSKSKPTSAASTTRAKTPVPASPRG